MNLFQIPSQLFQVSLQLLFDNLLKGLYHGIVQMHVILRLNCIINVFVSTKHHF